MWYAITGIDVEDSLDRRKAVRPAHLARLQKLLANMPINLIFYLDQSINKLKRENKCI